MLVGPDNGAIDVMDLPIKLASRIGLLLQGLQDPQEDAIKNRTMVIGRSPGLPFFGVGARVAAAPIARLLILLGA